MDFGSSKQSFATLEDQQLALNMGTEECNDPDVCIHNILVLSFFVPLQEAIGRRKLTVGVYAHHHIYSGEQHKGGNIERSGQVKVRYKLTNASEISFSLTPCLN